MSATLRPPSPPEPGRAPASVEEVVTQLEETWRPRPGLWHWLRSVDHKVIATRYTVTALVFFLLAGLEAAIMRAQLARPENGVLGPDAYNQFFTMHGTTMMFLFAVPVMQAAGLYLVPLMIGARNVAFPRLNAYGYWVYLFGGAFLYVMFFLNTGPDVGWFSYVPLSGPEFSPGKRADVWAQTITFTEIAALVASVELIVTIFKNRAPGMTLNRMPLFVWAMLVQSFMVLFAMPWVATRCCGSICSGSSGIPRSTSSSSPRSGSSARLWRPSPAGRCSATRRWCSRWWAPPSSGSGSGSTTCSPPGCPSWARASSPRPA
jgi:cytochrome c oxidase subunit I+III